MRQRAAQGLKRRVCLWALLALGGVAIAATAQAQEAAVFAGDAGEDGRAADTSYKGRLAARHVITTDSQGFQAQLLFFDADLDVKELARFGDKGRLNFMLNSRFLLDFTQSQRISNNEFTGDGIQLNERRFGQTQTFADVRELYVEAEDLGPVDIRAGRVWLFQAGGAWADGAQLQYNLSRNWSTGIFGGLQPDPFDYLPTADRQTAGTYAAYEADRFQFSGAYTAQLFGGNLDRHYLFSRAHWSVPTGNWGKSLFLSYYASLDLPNADAQVDDPVLTSFFTNATYWANNTLNFSVHYARFATSRLADPRQNRFAAEENQRPLLGNVINQGAYDQVRLSAVQRFSHYHVYQQIDIRDRNLLDQRTAIYYRTGIRDSGFLGTNLFLHGRLTVRNNFLSDSTEFLVEAGHRFGTSFEIDAAVAYQTGGSLIALQDQDVFFANARASYDFTPDIYLSLDYDLTVETNIQQEELETAGSLLVHTVFTRLSYRL